VQAARADHAVAVSILIFVVDAVIVRVHVLEVAGSVAVGVTRIRATRSCFVPVDETIVVRVTVQVVIRDVTVGIAWWLLLTAFDSVRDAVPIVVG
jgi:hypothetical protein